MLLMETQHNKNRHVGIFPQVYWSLQYTVWLVELSSGNNDSNEKYVQTVQQSGKIWFHLFPFVMEQYWIVFGI